MPRLLTLSFVGLAAIASARAVAGPAEPPAAAAMPRCAAATIADVRLPSPVGIDEIRVIVAGHDQGGTARLTVDAGGFDRVLHVRGESRGLSFFPALTSAEFRVSLDPDFAASTPCVERIELRRGGTPVATVVP